jgi:hypothetical protein
MRLITNSDIKLKVKSKSKKENIINFSYIDYVYTLTFIKNIVSD